MNNITSGGGINSLMLRYFQAANAATAKSIKNIASGRQINSAADNASGLAIAQKMYAQTTGLRAASQNTQDAVSMVRVADGALGGVHDIMNRMSELAMRAGNGTLGEEERGALQAEYDQLSSEIDRIGKSTTFNGNKLFDGSDYTMQVGETPDDTMEIGMDALSAESLGLKGANLMSADGAMQAQKALREATKSVSSQRGTLGAAENRLQSTYNTLGINEINIQDSLSRIMDTDIGKESINRGISNALGQVSVSLMKNASYLMQYNAMQLLR